MDELGDEDAEQRVIKAVDCDECQYARAAMIHIAKEVRDHAIEVGEALQVAIDAYEVGDLCEVRRALYAASVLEKEAGDDPATQSLAEQLLCIAEVGPDEALAEIGEVDHV